MMVTFVRRLIYAILTIRCSANALQCRVCFSEESLEKCASEGQLSECTEEQVALTNSRLSIFKSILVTSTSEQESYQCFQVQLKSLIDGRFRFVGGCAYQEADVCGNGWLDADVTHCSTCSSSDNCEEETIRSVQRSAIMDVSTSEATASTALSPIHCSVCVSTSNWESCETASSVVECTDELVGGIHNFLTQYHPKLAQIPPTPRTFQCSRLELELLVPTNAIYLKSCTYKQSDFCDDWIEGATVRNCAICSTGDPSSECNEWDGPKIPSSPDTSTTAMASSTTLSEPSSTSVSTGCTYTTKSPTTTTLVQSSAAVSSSSRDVTSTTQFITSTQSEGTTVPGYNTTPSSSATSSSTLLPTESSSSMSTSSQVPTSGSTLSDSAYSTSPEAGVLSSTQQPTNNTSDGGGTGKLCISSLLVLGAFVITKLLN